MSAFYRLAYAIGFTPWKAAGLHPAATAQIGAALDRAQAELGGSTGTALDLGCGLGHWTIELARRGWQVTGVDNIAKAVAGAKEKARAADVTARFIEGDLTELRQTGLEPGIRLFLDIATLHGLAPSARSAAAREITALAAPGAELVSIVWSPGRRGPLPGGMAREDFEAAFPAWTVLQDEAADPAGLPPPLRRVMPRLFRLRCS